MDTIIFLALLAVSIQYLVLHWIGYINIQKKKHDYVIALIRFFFSVGWFVAMMAVGCAKLHILHDTTLFATYAMILGAGNFCALFVFIGFYFEHERMGSCAYVTILNEVYKPYWLQHIQLRDGQYYSDLIDMWYEPSSSTWTNGTEWSFLYPPTKEEFEADIAPALAVCDRYLVKPVADSAMVQVAV